MLKRSRSFHRGIVDLCRSKGCKVVVCQTLKMILLSGSQTPASLEWSDSGRMAEFFSNLQLWQLITLQPFEPQRPTVPLWKYLNLLKTYFWLKTGRIFKMPSFFSFKHRPYFVRAWFWLRPTVYSHGLILTDYCLLKNKYIGCSISKCSEGIISWNLKEKCG